MLKKLFITLLLYVCLPVFAGEYEDAIKNNEKVLLYLYTPNCRYCELFMPTFEKLAEKYNNKCKFLKINTETRYGYQLASLFRIKFVPYVILVKSKDNRGIVITPQCLLEYSCSEKILEDFVK